MASVLLEDADTHSDELNQVVEELTTIVESEVKAFQSLLDTLLDQQASILKGDSLSVSMSNKEVERIVAVTHKLERERRGKSQHLSRYLKTDEELTLTEIIPLVEKRYSERLKEMKDMLHVLSPKIQSTNKRNRYLLEHSLKFVDNCLRILVKGQDKGMAYSREGKITERETSLYSGTG